MIVIFFEKRLIQRIIIQRTKLISDKFEIQNTKVPSVSL